MDILDKAIEAEGGLGNGGVQQLAKVLGLGGSNVISNWRKRGHIPDGWAAVLQMKYGESCEVAQPNGKSLPPQPAVE